jgi:hypothetical protein
MTHIVGAHVAEKLPSFPLGTYCCSAVVHIGNEEVGTHIEESGVFAIEHSSASRYKLTREQVQLMHLDPALHRHENTDSAAARVIVPPFPMPDSDEDEGFEDADLLSESSDEDEEEEAKQVSYSQCYRY